jgi:hypothetical protein
MGIDKSELKILIANNIGADIEDQLESSKRTVHQLEGAVAALGQAATAVPLGVIAKIDKILEEGVIKDDMPALQVYTLLKKYVTKCGDFLQHLSEVEKLKVTSQHGEVRGIEFSLGLIKKIKDDEIKKVEALAKFLEDESKSPNIDRRGRPVGAHPGGSSLAERRAEGKKLKAEQETTDFKKITEPEIKDDSKMDTVGATADVAKDAPEVSNVEAEAKEEPKKKVRQRSRKKPHKKKIKQGKSPVNAVTGDYGEDRKR